MSMLFFCSSEEAGKYVELYKVYENKPADMLQARGEDDYLSKVFRLRFFLLEIFLHFSLSVAFLLVSLL